MTETILPLAEAPGPDDHRIVLTSPHDTVQLRQLIIADAEAYFKLIHEDPGHLRDYDETITEVYKSPFDIARSITHPSMINTYRFGIWDGNVLIGGENLRPSSEGRAEIGYWVAKKFIGQEYAGRGRSLLTQFAFENLGLESVFCRIVIGNDKSKRSVEKSGFRLQGEQNGEWVFVLNNPQTKT